MQCGQPPYGNVFYNNTENLQAINPELVGEGDVTYLLFPDGSIQYYFQPRNNPYNPSISKTVWIVRSISSPNMNNHQNYVLPPLVPYLLPTNTDAPIAPQPPQYQLKFHNDSCTSSTDLHCHFPQRKYEWIPKPDALQLTEHCRCKAITNTVSKMSLDEGQNIKPKPYKCECGYGPQFICPCRNLRNEYSIGDKITCECSHVNANIQNKDTISKEANCRCGVCVQNTTDKVVCKCEESSTKTPVKLDKTRKLSKKKLNNKAKTHESEQITCDKQISTFTDQSNSYSCDQNCGTTSNNDNETSAPPKSNAKRNSVKQNRSDSSGTDRSSDCSCVCCKVGNEDQL